MRLWQSEDHEFTAIGRLLENGAKNVLYIGTAKKNRQQGSDAPTRYWQRLWSTRFQTFENSYLCTRCAGMAALKVLAMSAVFSAAIIPLTHKRTRRRLKRTKQDAKPPTWHPSQANFAGDLQR